jgi:hypothetical protein
MNKVQTAAITDYKYSVLWVGGISSAIHCVQLH